MGSAPKTGMGTALIAALGALTGPIVSLFTSKKEFERQQQLLKQQADLQAATALAQQRLVILVALCMIAVLLVWGITNSIRK